MKKGKHVSIISTILLVLSTIVGLLHEVNSLQSKLSFNAAKESGPSIEAYLMDRLEKCENSKR